MSLEHTREVLRIFKSELFGCLGDGCPGNEYVSCSLHDKSSYGIAGRVARELPEEVTEVVGREKQFLCAILDGRQSFVTIDALGIISVEQTLESREQVGCLGRWQCQALFIEACHMLKNELNVGHNDVSLVTIVRVGQFAANGLKQCHNVQPLCIGH